ncbi:IS3 family transposase [Sporomusa rhizae]|uniref:IS3 family transposase n=1 Tax=Sporomusa rhizae TaxID=357999 RepID=UPI00352A1F9B
MDNGVEGLYKENKQGKKHRTFSAEFKKAVIDDLIENKRNYKETADIYDLNPQMIEKWERVYKEEGYEGLNRKSGNRTHLTGEFKQKIIEDMHQNKLGYEKTAAIYGVNIKKIAQWERIYLEEGRAGLNKKKRVHAVLEGSQILDKQVEEDLIAEVQRLRMENEYLKKLNALGSSKEELSAKEKAAIVYELGQKHPVSELIKIAGMARSTYYYCLKSINKPDQYAQIKKEILEIWQANKGRYGYRRITFELRTRYTINHKTVQKLMGALGLKSLVRIKRYRSYKGAVGKIAPNILKRDFNATSPNTKWVTDITQFSLFGQKLYLSPILDLFNGEIVSYTITKRPNFALVKSMLEQAFAKLPAGAKPILHSDQGWHYRIKRYQELLESKEITQSMSRKGNCFDNSVMENFFGHLKSELLYLQNFESVEHFIDEVHKYIYYYNHFRIRNKLKGLSPIMYRLQSSVS